MTPTEPRLQGEADRPVADVAAMRLFYQSTIDAMAPNVAVMTRHGVIIAVNNSWRRFLSENGIDDPGFKIGGNYLALCENAGDANSAAIAAGVRALTCGGPGPFRHEYPCPWTTGDRWSRMSAVCVGEIEEPYLILSHEEITEQRRAQERQRGVTGRLLLAEDEERRRIGRDLHDGAAQKLAAAKLILGRGTGPEVVAEAQELLSEAISDLRTIADRLHPPMFDPLGLCAAIRRLVGRYTRETGITVNLGLPEDFPRLARAVEITFYGAAQEGLDNIRRHSGSHKASLSLAIDEDDQDCVRLVVRDHGKGGKAIIDGDGLVGLRLRVEQLGGSLALATAKPGMALTVKLPRHPDGLEATAADGG